MAGQPTKFNQLLVDDMNDYASKCEDQWKEYVKSSSFRSDDNGETNTQSVEWKLEGELPTIEGFSEYLYSLKRGVSVSALQSYKSLKFEGDNKEEMEEVKSQYLDSFERLLNLQKTRLLNGGITGRYNSTISKLLLSANHGLKEKSEVELSGSLSLGGALSEITGDKDDFTKS